MGTRLKKRRQMKNSAMLLTIAYVFRVSSETGSPEDMISTDILLFLSVARELNLSVLLLPGSFWSRIGTRKRSDGLMFLRGRVTQPSFVPFLAGG